MSIAALPPERLDRDQAEAIYHRLRLAVANAATEDEARAVADQIRTFVRQVRAARWEPYPWQHPHVHPPGWVSLRAPNVCDERCADLPVAPIPTHGFWLELGGRGTGKTEGAAHYINRHVEGPPCDTRVPGGHRLTIVAPTQTDAVASCVTGVSGLQMVNPGVKVTTTREGTTARWPSGAVARLLGGHTPDDLERLRAWSNVCCVWVEEAGAMRYLEKVLQMIRFGMRLGGNPHGVVTTTPRRRPGYTTLVEDDRNMATRGRTRDAHRLDPVVRAEYEAEFGGTTLGRQELDAEDIPDVEGALWVADRPDRVDGEPNKDERPGLENDRMPAGSVGWVSHPRPESLGGVPGEDTAPPADVLLTVSRTIVAVDPPGGRTECGIVVVGQAGTHGYTLADLSLAGPPNTWARVVLEAYFDFGAEGLAVEHTYGGDMVPNTIGTLAEALGFTAPPIFKVPTKVGKRLRAEPVQALAQQHRLHHVGYFPGLEGEQTTWVPADAESPNRLDAYVHGTTYLMIRSKAGRVSNPAASAVRMPSTFTGTRRRR